MGSDHLPILITLNEPAERDDCETNKYLYERADWTSFREESSKIFKSHQVYSSDSSVYNKNIVKAIDESAKNSIPTSSNRRRARNIHVVHGRALHL